MSSTDRPLTFFQRNTLYRAREVAVACPIFRSEDVNEQMAVPHSRTSSIEVALNYLAATGWLIRLRKGVFRVPAPILVPKEAAHGR